MCVLSVSVVLHRYLSALAVSARVATSLAELMYGEYGGDMEDYWRGAWEAAAGLPAGVAAAGCLREVGASWQMSAHASHSSVSSMLGRFSTEWIVVLLAATALLKHWFHAFCFL